VINRRSMSVAGAALVAAPVLAVLAAGPASAAGPGDVIVTNTETVQAYLDASGRLEVARVYDQIAMQGNGTVDLSNPVEPQGLRNLDGFAGFDVVDGNLVGSFTVDGDKRLRTVSDFTKKLPLEVQVSYTLDGTKVEPGDVVGGSGVLKVQYTVRNVTGLPKEVSFDDGTGTTVTATEDVVIPMVGSLSTVLPSTFTDVRSDEANMAGDGRGGTKMSFTMTLFGPIGKPQATFGYQARITNGVVPQASISALPVSPLDSPSFKGGAESYKGGAQTGATLTAGATQIDANLLKLRDGAGELLAGLIKLRDGADRLNAGLAGQAGPGSKELAAGAGKLKDGTGQLAAGADDAKDGSAQVADGADLVASGSAELSDGLTLLQNGVSQLSDNASVADGVAQLKTALDAVRAGIGTTEAEGTLLWGVDQLQAGVNDMSLGLSHPAGAAGATDPGGVKQVLTSLLTQLDNGDLANPGAKQALARIVYGLDHDPVSATDMGAKQAITTLQASLGCPDNDLGVDEDGEPDMAYLATHPTDLCTVIAPSIADPKVEAALGTKVTLAKLRAGLGAQDVAGQTALYGLAQIQSKLGSRTAPGQTALYALNELVKGVGDASTPGTLLYGLNEVHGGLTQVHQGLSNPGCSPADPANEDNPCGVKEVQGLVSAGVDQLVEGIADSLSGVLGEASAGAGALAAGAGELADGAGRLDHGLGELSAGAGTLDAGAGDLQRGAGQLSDGLTSAADGSGQLADGLRQAADGAPALEDGAQRLSDEGTTKLVEAGKSTAADYGQKYALIEAGAQRAKAEGMAYGAPAEAAGNTAYSYELAGMDGEGGRNLGRGLGALAVFGLAGGAAVLRSRFL
jgi:putative membrane protein